LQQTSPICNKTGLSVATQPSLLQHHFVLLQNNLVCRRSRLNRNRQGQAATKQSHIATDRAELQQTSSSRCNSALHVATSACPVTGWRSPPAVAAETPPIRSPRDLTGFSRRRLPFFRSGEGWEVFDRHNPPLSRRSGRAAGIGPEVRTAGARRLIMRGETVRGHVLSSSGN